MDTIVRNPLNPAKALETTRSLFKEFDKGTRKSWHRVKEQLCIGSRQECEAKEEPEDEDDGSGGGQQGGRRRKQRWWKQGRRKRRRRKRPAGSGGGPRRPLACRYITDPSVRSEICEPKHDPPPPGGGGTGDGGSAAGGDGSDASGGRGGTIHGDPHVVTLDDGVYTMQSVGEFVLAETEGWTTQVRFVPADRGQPFSVTDVLATQMGDDVIVLDAALPYAEGSADVPSITLNGQPVESSWPTALS